MATQTTPLQLYAIVLLSNKREHKHQQELYEEQEKLKHAKFEIDH